VWNRQRTDKDLADPADVSLGHKSMQRWNLPDGWVISNQPAHQALVGEADYIAAQDVSATRGPATRGEVSSPERRRYLLAGIIVCGTCGRRMESAWSNGKPAYRCRHGHTTGSPSDPGRAKNAYVREDRIVAHLPALRLLLAGVGGSEAQRRRCTRRGADARHHVSPEDVIAALRNNDVTLTFDPAAGPCTRKAPRPSRSSPGKKQANPQARTGPSRPSPERSQKGKTPIAGRRRQPAPR
jgi:site-specific DNA recombinase